MLTGYPNSMHRDRCLNLYKADAYEEKVPKGGFDVQSFSRDRTHTGWLGAHRQRLAGFLPRRSACSELEFVANRYSVSLRSCW